MDTFDISQITKKNWDDIEKHLYLDSYQYSDNMKKEFYHIRNGEWEEAFKIFQLLPTRKLNDIHLYKTEWLKAIKKLYKY